MNNKKLISKNFRLIKSFQIQKASIPHWKFTRFLCGLYSHIVVTWEIKIKLVENQIFRG